MTTHTYTTLLDWSGSTGDGYRAYSRDHRAESVPLSAAPEFRGDPNRLNPEQLLVMAASSCQLLSFLGEAARAGVDVVGYADNAEGTMPSESVPTRLTRIALTPVIRVSPGTDHDLVRALVEQAHERCYVAHSLTADVVVSPTVVDA
ncbi:OsmC family protein [Cellulomonas sp. P5_C5]